MKIAIVLIALVASGLQVAKAESLETCLTEVDAQVKQSLTYPEQVTQLGNFLRELNPQYSEKSLSELIFDKGPELDVVKSGHVQEAEIKDFVQVCGQYVLDLSKIVETVSHTHDCGENFMDKLTPTDPADFKLLEEYKNIDNAIGHAKACFNVF